MIFVPFSWCASDGTGIEVECGTNGNKLFCMMTDGNYNNTCAILYNVDDNICDYDDLDETERHYFWTPGGLIDLPNGLDLENGHSAENVSCYDDFNSALGEYM